MPKQCKAKGCEFNVFSHGYCKNHQHLRTDKAYKKSLERHKNTFYNKKGNMSSKKKKAKIKPKSDKRKAQETIYRYTRDEFIKIAQEEGRDYCIFCGEKINEEPDLHHLIGRDNDLLTNTDYWALAHPHCHIVRYHGGEPAHEIEWFDSFMERIKKISPRLYYVEKEKLRRSREEGGIKNYKL
jgi:hypothetical protein